MILLGCLGDRGESPLLFLLLDPASPAKADALDSMTCLKSMFTCSTCCFMSSWRASRLGSQLDGAVVTGVEGVLGSVGLSPPLVVSVNLVWAAKTA